jgi:hypothetical protein
MMPAAAPTFVASKLLTQTRSAHHDVASCGRKGAPGLRLHRHAQGHRRRPLAGAHRANKVVSILPFVRKAGTVFDDNATKVMGEAFDSACKELHDKGQPEIVYEVIARRIIDAAKKGKRDPIQLRKAGLKALGLDSEGKWTR